VRNPFSELEARFGEAVQVRNFGRSNRYVIEATLTRWVEVAAWLRMEESQRIDFLEALTVTELKGRFILSAFIRSHVQGGEVVLRTSLPVPGATERAEIPSLVGVWPHAEAFETELAPLFGIQFTGSRGVGGVRKFFGTYDGFPLRKNFDWLEESGL